MDESVILATHSIPLKKIGGRRMPVFHLIANKTQAETIAALKELLVLAEAGTLRGISCSYWRIDLGEAHVTTGLYWDNPTYAVHAALRAGLLMTEELKR